MLTRYDIELELKQHGLTHDEATVEALLDWALEPD